ncbi:integrase arm-type DNA-binding domain-containing protein [Chitinimonas sp. BJYL2]|uniref:tyrosine-type recombinase/integrase n=1 Tax=Chitinimonas sp. BJYL2 TaxID=2976696 RepID=UPI0022B3EAAC|nr:integrase arm-type DNA-binding domain-containing protein [Chitinimonas sp. BJYL2]
MPLTDIVVRNAKPQAKPYRLADGAGMYLEVSPAGGKLWRLKYRFGGKEKRIAFGAYPEVSIKDARAKREEARKLLAAGIDPSEHRKAKKLAGEERAASSFEVVAREWLKLQQGVWSHSHGVRIASRLQKDIFPWLGARPIMEITAPELLKTIRRIVDRGAVETAHRALSECGQVFRYAIATGRAERDPSGDLRGALPPVKGTNFAAATTPESLAEVLRAVECYKGTLIVACALKLAPLVFVRPGELRTAQWADFNFEAAEWRYRVTKTDTDHIVPLSRQALEILRELKPVTGSGRYVFPSARSKDRPMSDNAILSALRRSDIAKDEMTGHGFRAAARTILDEVLSFRPDVIEHQLAHAVRDPNGRAYNRTAHLAARKEMMQTWADYLDKIKK